MERFSVNAFALHTHCWTKFALPVHDLAHHDNDQVEAHFPLHDVWKDHGLLRVWNTGCLNITSASRCDGLNASKSDIRPFGPRGPYSGPLRLCGSAEICSNPIFLCISQNFCSRWLYLRIAACCVYLALFKCLPEPYGPLFSIFKQYCRIMAFYGSGNSSFTHWALGLPLRLEVAFRNLHKFPFLT